MSEPNKPVGAIFDATIELPPERRAGYLDTACGGDAPLRQRVEALLCAHELAGTFMGNPAVTAQRETMPTEKTGDRIGRYKLLQQIGEGGCGVVYMAEQEEPVRRQVALKVIKLGMDTKSVIARFEAERQALALMDHPNIAKVLDAGATDTGRPYFVMELVRGIKITDYCDENKLSMVARLELFVQVCQAIQHAHQKGIIHRDIKPSNILVADHDGVPVPKIIDFGIAKATTDQRLTDKTLFTAFEQFIGTPAYMSPEQARLSGLDIDTRSDIYSLGVLLYELLTGKTPFEATRLSEAGLDEIRRIIRDEEPLRPSTRLQTLDVSEQTTVAGRRQSVPPKLFGIIRGDLDWIVMKALEKDRARRYETASGFAADVQRHLKNEPVTACPPGNLYKFQKLVRRNKLAFVTSSIVVATGILGLTGIFWQWRQAKFNAQDAVKQRRIAEQDAAETRLNLYAADIAGASQALQNGNLRLARNTLDGLRPKHGEADLRGFEWRYLWNLGHGEQLATLTGHQGTVVSTSFSPDGNLLASGCMDGSVRIWNVSSHQNIAMFKLTSNQVWSVGFTPDGKWLMTGSSDNIAFRDVESWRVHTNFPGQVGVLSKTGTFLAVAESSPFFWDPAGAVTLWDWRTGQLLRRFDRPGRALALSADGRLFAMSGTNWNITVWDTATGKLLREFPMKHPVWSLDFSPDGHKLLATGWSREVSVWKLDDQSSPRIIKSQRLNFWSAAFSPDGTTIATGGTDQRLRFWNAATLELKSVLQGQESGIWCTAFSPDGKLLATGGADQTVMLWSTTAGAQSIIVHDADHRPLFSPDGKWLVTVDPASQNCMLWNVDKHTLVTPQVAGGRYVFGFSQDGKCVVTFDSNHGTLQFWRPGGNEPEKEVALQGKLPNPARFVFMVMSPAQDFIFAIDPAGLIRIWDTDTGHLLHIIQGPLPPIRNAILSPEGKYLALSVTGENVTRLYDCAAGTERQLVGHLDFISGLSFALDGHTLATGSMDCSVRLWNTATGECLATLPAQMGETSDVAISPDGKTLAALGKQESLILWHLPTLRQVIVEDEPQAGIHLRFSPDGRHLAVETDSDKLTLLAAPFN